MNVVFCVVQKYPPDPFGSGGCVKWESEDYAYFLFREVDTTMPIPETIISMNQT